VEEEHQILRDQPARETIKSQENSIMKKRAVKKTFPRKGLSSSREDWNIEESEKSLEGGSAAKKPNKKLSGKSHSKPFKKSLLEPRKRSP